MAAVTIDSPPLDFVFLDQFESPFRVRAMGRIYWLHRLNRSRTNWVTQRPIESQEELWRFEASAIPFELHKEFEFGVPFDEGSWPAKKQILAEKPHETASDILISSTTAGHCVIEIEGFCRVYVGRQRLARIAKRIMDALIADPTDGTPYKEPEQDLRVICDKKD